MSAQLLRDLPNYAYYADHVGAPFTYHDVLFTLDRVVHFIGDVLILGLHDTKIGRFLEVTPQDVGGVLSLMLSLLVVVLVMTIIVQVIAAAREHAYYNSPHYKDLQERQRRGDDLMRGRKQRAEFAGYLAQDHYQVADWVLSGRVEIRPQVLLDKIDRQDPRPVLSEHGQTAPEEGCEPPIPDLPAYLTPGLDRALGGFPRGMRQG